MLPSLHRGRYDAAVSTVWTEVGDRVFVRRYRFYDQDIVAVVGGGAALVVDTRSTLVQAREILDDLRELGHFEFQHWIVQRAMGTQSPRKVADMGIDGYSFLENAPR